MTAWTPERVQQQLEGYGVTTEVENTGGDVMCVVVEHDGFTLAIGESGAGVYYTPEWHDGGDPIEWAETANPTKQAFVGMAAFARVAGWRKAARA